MTLLVTGLMTCTFIQCNEKSVRLIIAEVRQKYVLINQQAEC